MMSIFETDKGSVTQQIVSRVAVESWINPMQAKASIRKVLKSSLEFYLQRKINNEDIVYEENESGDDVYFSLRQKTAEEKAQEAIGLRLPPGDYEIVKISSNASVSITSIDITFHERVTGTEITLNCAIGGTLLCG